MLCLGGGTSAALRPELSGEPRGVCAARAAPQHARCPIQAVRSMSLRREVSAAWLASQRPQCHGRARKEPTSRALLAASRPLSHHVVAHACVIHLLAGRTHAHAGTIDGKELAYNPCGADRKLHDYIVRRGARCGEGACHAFLVDNGSRKRLRLCVGCVVTQPMLFQIVGVLNGPLARPVCFGLGNLYGATNRMQARSGPPPQVGME